MQGRFWRLGAAGSVSHGRPLWKEEKCGEVLCGISPLSRQNPISSSRSSASEGFGSGSGASGLLAATGLAGLAALAGWPLPAVAPVVACFGGGMRTRKAPTVFPPKSVCVGYTTRTLPAHPSMSSPKLPRSVRLLVLLRIRPFWWLVNHSTGFCSPRGILSTVTALMRSAFSDTKSPAFINLDWSKADASRTMAVLLLFELRAFGCQPKMDLSSLFALVEPLAGPAFGRNRQT